MNKQRLLIDRTFYTACPQCSRPPVNYKLNSHPIEHAKVLLSDGSELACWANHTYNVRDGILLALSQPSFSGNDIVWAFTATSERQGLVDLKIGEVEEVVFDEPFEEVFYVTKSHVPPRLARKDSGLYKFQICVDVLSREGFKFISSYYSDSPRTNDEECFMIGWNAYGRMKDDPMPPIWRRMLANAHIHLLSGVWYLALLEAAFCLESFFDGLLSAELSSRKIPDNYIKHVLRVGERKYEIRAIRELRDYPPLSFSRIENWIGEIDRNVFTPRNSLAHGKCGSAEITREAARAAVMTVQEAIWDWDIDSRKWLLLIERESSIYDLRDEAA
jgi:hypothetical protein